MAKVRKADIRDESELMQLCRELHEENGLFTMNEDLVRANLRHAFMNNGGVIGVIGEPGKMEAAIYIKLGTFWYSDQLHLEELFVFVRPEFRKSSNAKDLITFAKKCSEELNIPLVTGIITNERTEAKVRLYERQFPKKAGAFFLYNSKFNH
jgi:N-acetylglutamate synthase-like GNAT family acetyltransferase